MGEEDAVEEEETEEVEKESKPKKFFSLTKKSKKDKEEEPAEEEEPEAPEEEEETEKVEKPKKSFFRLSSKKKDLKVDAEEAEDEPVPEEDITEKITSPKEEKEKKKSFGFFKKKTPSKAVEDEPAEEEPQGLYDTEAESKSSESVENKITVHNSHDEVRENVGPQPVVLSASSAASPATSPIAADMQDLSPKESIMSPDRSTKYQPLPAHNVPTPLPAEKADNQEEESVEDVTPASPKPDDKLLEDVPMDKPLSPRSDAPTDDKVSPKAQSIAQATTEDEPEETVEKEVPEEESPEVTMVESDLPDASISQKLSQFCTKGPTESNVNSDETQNAGMFCGCFGP